MDGQRGRAAVPLRAPSCPCRAAPALGAVLGRPQLWKSRSKPGNRPSPTGEFPLGTWAKQTGDFPFPTSPPAVSPGDPSLLRGNPPALSAGISPLTSSQHTPCLRESLLLQGKSGSGFSSPLAQGADRPGAWGPASPVPRAARSPSGVALGVSAHGVRGSQLPHTLLPSCSRCSQWRWGPLCPLLPGPRWPQGALSPAVLRGGDPRDNAPVCLACSRREADGTGDLPLAAVTRSCVQVTEAWSKTGLGIV